MRLIHGLGVTWVQILTTFFSSAQIDPWFACLQWIVNLHLLQMTWIWCLSCLTFKHNVNRYLYYFCLFCDLWFPWMITCHKNNKKASLNSTKAPLDIISISLLSAHMRSGHLRYLHVSLWIHARSVLTFLLPMLNYYLNTSGSLWARPTLNAFSHFDTLFLWSHWLMQRGGSVAAQVIMVQGLLGSIVTRLSGNKGD